MKAEVLAIIELAMKVADYDKQIASLGEQRQQVVDDLEALVTGGGSNILSLQEPTEIRVRRGRTPSANTTMERVANLLKEHPEMEFDAEIVSKETAINTSTVRTNLSKLVRERVIEKRSFNTYGAIRQEKEASKEEAS